MFYNSRKSAMDTLELIEILSIRTLVDGLILNVITSISVEMASKMYQILDLVEI